MSSSPPRIQIAFQGGGAKLVAMLPVAAAFKKCHDEGVIKISAVSGASAGAICAGLIAGDADFKEVIDFLRSSGQEFVRKIVSAEAREFSDLMQQSKWDKFKYILQNGPFLYRIIIGGHPILEEGEFKKFIKEIFKSAKSKRIEKCKIKLHINASNIVAQENANIENGYIYSAVADSASIPLAFRSFRALSKSHLVDGGLCQNLPTDILVQNGPEPIFVVFPDHDDEPKEISNILQYCFSLFSASINHNVHRSRQNVSDAFSIPAACDYGTFDFDAALEKLRDEDWYINAFKGYERQIRDFSKTYGTVNSDKQYRYADVDGKDEYMSALDMMSRDYDTYIEYESGRFHVTVNCDRFYTDKEDAPDRPADNIVKTAVIKVKKEGFRYYRSFLGVDSETKKPRPTVWAARNLRTNRELDISVLALKGDASGPNAGKHCLVVFNKADEQISVGDEIEVIDSSYSRDGMIEMNRRRNDFISLHNAHGIVTKKVELVISYPRSLGIYKMLLGDSSSQINRESVQEIEFSEEEKKLRPDFINIGIETKNLEPGQKFSGIAYRNPD